MKPSGRNVFEVLVREHEPALTAFVRACVYDMALADDVVQESFVVAWEHFRQYDRARPFAAWLRGIARKKILSHYRSAATAQRHLRILADEQISAVTHIFDPLTNARGETFGACLKALQECVRSLGEEHREIVDRTYRRKESCVVAAAAVGVSVDALRKRLQRARDLLRQCLHRKLRLEALADA